MDNIIEWVFEKMFNQLTLDGKELYQTPFHQIREKTFDSDYVINLIQKLTSRPRNTISNYLRQTTFIEKILFQKIKKKLNVQILLGNFEKIKGLSKYQPDCISVELAVLNNRLDILEYIIQPRLLSNKLLMSCAEYGYDDIYFFLRQKGLVPNLSIYQKAALGNSLAIVKDVSSTIGLTNKILNSAYQANNTTIILFLNNIAKEENMKIPLDLINYVVLNANFELLKGMNLTWDRKLYYSALLSGSLDMIKYIESVFPDLHNNHLLDTSVNQRKKGRSSLLLGDMMYDKKYFSHCINYAIQSNSIAIVKYIHNKGYGITVTNIITAIKQASVEILQYICDNYNEPLPGYLIHYFGIRSHIVNKIDKARIVFKRIINNTMTVDDYRKDTIHQEMIEQVTQIDEANQNDIDYLMKYYIFFVPIPGYKLNNRLITLLRIGLELDLELDQVFYDKNKQLLVDCLYLFGNINQIKKYHPLCDYILPKKEILMELMCYCQINKFCYLMNYGLLTQALVTELRPIQIMLSDCYLDSVFSKVCHLDIKESDLQYILLSGKGVDAWLELYSSTVEKEALKILFQHYDIETIKKFNLTNAKELVSWAQESDLLELYEYLVELHQR